MLIDDAYLPLAAVFAGYRFVFERQAIAYDYPTELDVEFQRKVRTLAGLFQVVRSYPRLLNIFTAVGFHFFSYKLGRLLLPYAVLLAAIGSFGLPHPWRELALASQGVFYGLVIVDRWIPAGNALKKLTGASRTFLVLLAAAFCAGSILVIPPGKLWKQTQVKAAPERVAAMREE